MSFTLIMSINAYWESDNEREEQGRQVLSWKTSVFIHFEEAIEEIYEEFSTSPGKLFSS